MTAIQAVLAALAAVVLFQFALKGFSRELREVGGRALRVWLGRATANRWTGALVGAGATAVVQSSSAVSSLAVALVDSATISFRASLAVALGANVGTTVTAWLVSFKLTGIGPFFIVMGGVLQALPRRARVVGQALFYFGLIFFALHLISQTLGPVREQPLFMEWLAHAHNPWVGLLFGLAFTAIVQSSSVTTGLAILFVQQDILPPEAAIPIVIGATVGTTATPLLASLALGRVARASAVSHLLFNATGVLLFLPVLIPFSRFVVRFMGGADMAVAAAHLTFNLGVALLFLLLLGRLAPLLARWMKVEERLD